MLPPPEPGHGEGKTLPSSARREALFILRYCAAGLVNSLLGFAVIIFCMSGLGLPPLVSNAAGFAGGYLCSYMLHRKFTFRSTVAHGRGLPAWLAVTALGYAANLAVLTSLLARCVDGLWAQAAAVAAYVAITFLLGRLFVFGRGG